MHIYVHTYEYIFADRIIGPVDLNLKPVSPLSIREGSITRKQEGIGEREVALIQFNQVDDRFLKSPLCPQLLI